uniref:isoleucine--tRNA ligase n=1 Tax=Fagus sylvatica TaxID=28930 RepID=A0A2N9FJH6_FAGSY
MKSRRSRHSSSSQKTCPSTSSTTGRLSPLDSLTTATSSPVQSRTSFTRFQAMKGHHVTRRFGWDCHGLPVENEIDGRLGLKKREDVLKLGIDKYNEQCRSIVTRYVEEWEKIVWRTGRWIDFKAGYKTMDLSFMETVWWVFAQLFEKGLVYKGFKVMPYSTGCKTPISNFEAGQEYRDVPDPEIMVTFPIIGDPHMAAFVAWTTTPWTLPSNLALCVNADFVYVKVRNKYSGKVYLVAESRLSALPTEKPKQNVSNGSVDDSKKSNPKTKGPSSGKAGNVADSYEVLEKVSGASLVGLKYEPLFDYFKEYSDSAFRVVADNYVTDDSGTGIVHCAPAFGEDDYRVCIENKVISKGENLIVAVDDDGCFITKITDFSGQYVKDADKYIIEAVKAAVVAIIHLLGMCSDAAQGVGTSLVVLLLIWGVVLSGQTLRELGRGWGCYRHTQLHLWRFIKVEELKEKLLENNKQTYWVPDFVKEKRFHNWLENARDWAVSRSRFWGTPLPIWISEDGEELLVMDSIEKLEKLSGVKVDDLHRHKIDHITIPSSRGPEFGVLRRVDDVFDCWFESGSMPYAYIHYPFENVELFEKNFPGHFVAEGLDQTRGWFYTLMVLSTALFGKPAFRNLICNGLVLAEDGKKMSKSLKNYPSPLEVIDDYGAEKRFHNWLENARDWAVSRSRFWGTPLPIWISEDGEELLVMDSIEKLEKLSGVKVDDLHRHKIDHITIPSSRGPEFGVLRRVDDVFDCWFESGSMPYAYIHYPFENVELFEKNFPGHFVAEGLDQTRGWFYTLMVLSTALFGKPAFRNLICNGLVLAEDGKKMSKSLKNYPSPLEVIDDYGADALRLYLINSPVVRAEPLRFKKEGVHGVVKDVFLPWYNAYRFLVQNAKRLEVEGLEQFIPFDQAKLQDSSNVLDQWINSATQSLVYFVRQEMDGYRLYTVLLVSCKVMAPFTPFFTEVLYQNLRKVSNGSEESIHYCRFPQEEGERDERIEQSVARMMTIIDLARNIRERHNKPLKTPLREMVVVHPDADFLNDIAGKLREYVLEELNVRSLVPCNDTLKYASLRAEPDFSVLGKRLGKSMGVVAKEVKAMSQENILAFEKAGEVTIAGHCLKLTDIKVVRDFKRPDGMTEKEIDAAGDGKLQYPLDYDVEIVNRIQKLRKKAGLEPTDIVEVYFKSLDEDKSLSERVLNSQDSYIADAISSHLLPSAVMPSNAITVNCIENLPPVDLVLNEHLFLSVGDYFSRTQKSVT